MEIPAEQSAFEKVHIPEGIHHAVFIGTTDAPDGQYGPRVALDFEVYYSTNEKPARIGRVYGKKLTPKSKLWEALKAIGAELEVGKTFDTDTLAGKLCRVTVEDYEDNDNNTVSGISKVKQADPNTESFIKNTNEKVSGLEKPEVEEEIVADDLKG